MKAIDLRIALSELDGDDEVLVLLVDDDGSLMRATDIFVREGDQDGRRVAVVQGFGISW